MTRLFSILVILIPAAAAPLPASQTPVERAWLNLQQGVTSKQAKTLMKTPGSSDPASLDAVNLPPFGVYIGQVQ